MDLRHYSKQVELELQQIEQKSIRDCILQQRRGVLLLKRAFCGGMVLTASWGRRLLSEVSVTSGGNWRGLAEV